MGYLIPEKDKAKPVDLSFINPLVKNASNRQSTITSLSSFSQQQGPQSPFNLPGAMISTAPTQSGISGFINKMRNLLPKGLSEPLFGTGREKDTGAFGFFYGGLTKTTQQKFDDRVEKLEEWGVSTSRASEIAANDITGQKQNLTETERDILNSVGRWEMVDKGLDSLDFIPIFGGLLKGGLKPVVKRLAQITDSVLIRKEVDKVLPNLDPVIKDSIIPQLSKAKTEAEVEQILGDAVKQVVNPPASPALKSLRDELFPAKTKAVNIFEGKKTSTEVGESLLPKMGGRSLFHGTDAFDGILKDGKIIPKMERDFTDVDARPRSRVIEGTAEKAGKFLPELKTTSLSQDPRHAGTFGDVIFEFDRKATPSMKDVRETRTRVVKNREVSRDEREWRTINDLPISEAKVAYVWDRGEKWGDMARVRQLEKAGVKDVRLMTLGGKDEPSHVIYTTQYGNISDAFTKANAPTPQEVRATTDKAIKKYGGAAKQEVVVDTPATKKVKEAKTPNALKQLLEELLTPISSRLARINPKLGVAIRKLEFDVTQAVLKDSEGVLPLMKAKKSLTRQERAVFDIAQKNGDKKVMDALASKYGFTEALDKARATIDGIFDRAKMVDIEVGYRESYFPRLVKDPKAFLDYLHGGSGARGEMQKLIQTHAEAKGLKYSDLSDEEKAGILNSYIRGFGDKLQLTKPANTKLRSIEKIDEKLNNFYDSSDNALIAYIQRMNDEIEGRKFFGKELAVDGVTKGNVNDSIGQYVLNLLEEGKIAPSQEKEISDMFKARFHRGKMNGALDVYRNLEYMSTMGSPTSAITQIGDLTWSFYENGVYHAIKGLTKSVLKSSNRLTREDFGLRKITEEFQSDTLAAKALEKVFKYTGLTKMDAIGKETLLNSTMSRMQSKALAGDEGLMTEMRKLFDETEAQVAFAELAEGSVTPRTKLVLWNKILDYQPIAKSEMPQKYLEMPNGRIFYMLKSFTLKQFDVFRREAIDHITSGDATRVVRGVRNLAYLSGTFMLANATADEIKDTLLGRETSLSDRTIDNLWRLVGATKYDIYKAQQEGVGNTILKKILFPTSIFDNLSKDVRNLIENKKYKTGPLKGESYKSEAVQSIPVGGKLYYWWMGRGAQKEMYSDDVKVSPLDKLNVLDSLDSLDALSGLDKLNKLDTLDELDSL